MKPTFETKEQYLAWRTEWRARYAELSKDIRALKLARRACASGLGRDRWTAQRPKIAATVKRFTDPKTGVFQWWTVWQLQEEARLMLEWRKAAKLRAQEQYLKAHQTSTVPS
jgi:hypothetical protein